LRAAGRIFLNCAAIAFGVLILCGARPGISAQTAKPAAAQPAGEAQLGGARLVVTGDVEHTLSLSLTDLGTLPRKTVTVMNEHEGKMETYQGVPLEEILKRAGVPQGEKLRGAAMATTVQAEAADGYRVVFSLAELDSGITDSDALVADTLNDEPLPDKIGPLRLVLPHDKRPARWVRMLRSLTVVNGSH
jgi:DMSO/TMAO reductase YedYZ molybdopterin-dependent catalytic subunit